MKGGVRAEDIVGVVLAGGSSARMGEHKPAIRLRKNMPDLLSHAIGLLRACTDEVWVSCRQGQTVPDCRCVHDREEGLGPIGGVVSALAELARSPYRAAFILSCDLPFMNKDTLVRLVSARWARRSCQSRRDAKPEALMTTFRQAETGYIEALVAIYEQDALPFFEQALAARVRQINLVLRPEQRTDVIYTRSEALPFFNVNYPEDLETARQMAAGTLPLQHVDRVEVKRQP
jgi:molybdopterin-guanine dinucleotide biosynthesis protein A